MASLLFICPKTNQQASTGIETDVKSLSASWRAMFESAAARVHEISVLCGEPAVNSTMDALPSGYRR